MERMPTSNGANAQYQYMGSYVQSPMYSHMSATACNFLLPPAASVADFRVPPLRCSFPSLLNPQYELVKEQCDAWIFSFLQPAASPAACRLLLDCLVSRLPCRTIPTASSLLRLIQVTKMISWLIIADDEDDLPDALGADVSATSRSAALIMAILRCQNCPTPSALPIGEEDQGSLESARKASKRENSRALEALAQLWEEMCRDMPPNLRARFVSTMEDYLDALKVQAAYRKARRLPDIEAYMPIRRQASFILPSFSLVEYAMGIELPEHVYAHPQVQKFRTSVVDYICLCNDLLSCRVEMAVGDYFNMPSIVYNMSPNKQKCETTFQDAVNFVARMIEELDAQIISIQSSLPSLQCPSLKTYISSLGYCMSGSLAWFLETARYSNP